MSLSHGKPSPLLEKQLTDYGVIRTIWPNMFASYCLFPEEREVSKRFFLLDRAIVLQILSPSDSLGR